jgi:hypothetical protein
MNSTIKCEYCSRPIKGGQVNKMIRGKEHIFCTEFCFRLYFYSVPTISYDDLNKMYTLWCVDVKAPDFRTLVVEED